MVNIYTKTGDQGETSLFGGRRVKKSCLEVDAIGEVDETNGYIGVLASALPGEPPYHDTKEYLHTVQHRLFTVGSNIAAIQMALGSMPQIQVSDIISLEAWIDEMQADLKPLTQFIVPGGNLCAAHAFLARAVCRRAERRVVEVCAKYPDLSPYTRQYLNRLSDALFVLARWLNTKTGHPEVVWQK